MQDFIAKYSTMFSMFFSNWALIFHFLYYLNIIPSTYSIALFVFVGGSSIMLYNYFLYPKFLTDNKYVKYNIISHITHILPLVVFIYYKNTQFRCDILLISLVVYVTFISTVYNINPIDLYFNIPSHLK